MPVEIGAGSWPDQCRYLARVTLGATALSRPTRRDEIVRQQLRHRRAPARLLRSLDVGRTGRRPDRAPQGRATTMCYTLFSGFTFAAFR